MISIEGENLMSQLKFRSDSDVQLISQVQLDCGDKTNAEFKWQIYRFGDMEVETFVNNFTYFPII